MFNAAVSQADTELMACRVIEQPGQVDQHYRPFNTNYTENIENQLLELNDRMIFDTSIHGMDARVRAPIRSAEVSNLGAQMFVASDVAVKPIGIVGGWGERRASINLQFRTDSATGTVYEYLSGFTDHFGATLAGNYDPNMIVWFNNYIRIRVTTSMTPQGRVMTPTIEANTQILSQATMNQTGIGDPSRNHLTYTMRARETMRNITILEHGISHQMNIVRPGIEISKPTMVARQEVIPGDYVATILNSMNEVNGQQQVFDNTMQFNAGIENVRGMEFSQAADKIKSPEAMHSNIFRKLEAICGFMQTGFIRMGDLLANWPDYNDGRYTTTFIQNGELNDLRNTSESWGKITPFGESRVAFTLSHVVPALMARTMTGYVDFEMTNMTIDGSVQIAVMGGNGTAGYAPLFQEMSIPELFHRFMADLKSEVHETIVGCMGGQGVYHLKMTSNLYGNSMITISLNGNPAVPYSAPNFCNALTNPTVAANHEQVFQFAGDVRKVIDTACQVDMPQVTNVNQTMFY